MHQNGIPRVEFRLSCAGFAARAVHGSFRIRSRKTAAQTHAIDSGGIASVKRGDYRGKVIAVTIEHVGKRHVGLPCASHEGHTA